MSKKVFYRQCRYESLDGKHWDVSWLPEDLAKVGKLIYFGEKRDPSVPFLEDSETFRVVMVGDRRRDQAAAQVHARDHKNQRKASDI